jgi:hypothetical protein
MKKIKWLSAKQVDRLGNHLVSHYTTFKKNRRTSVIIDSAKTTKSLLRLYYYFNDGYFDVTTAAILDTVKPKKSSC